MNFKKYSFSSKPKQMNSTFKFQLNKGRNIELYFKLWSHLATRDLKNNVKVQSTETKKKVWSKECKRDNTTYTM